MLQAYVADGEDAYELVAETLTGWLLAPGEVSVEFATEIAEDLGTLTAALHATLAAARGVPDFEPRPATRAELRRWHDDAQDQLERALGVTSGQPGRVLHGLASRIAEELTVFEALPTEPMVTRVHADFHLGQVLVAPDGYRIIDFEGEPTRTLEERRGHTSPLRDVASMLRSIDHAGRSAGHRAEARNGGPLASPGLDLPAWLVRSRERFLDAYRRTLRREGAPINVDPALLRAFEIEKECYEFVYAATFLPEWLWAPTEGMQGLFADDPRGR
jgi:maltose alpha-D-glucosyltransferase/alpha-amylase